MPGRVELRTHPRGKLRPAALRVELGRAHHTVGADERVGGGILGALAGVLTVGILVVGTGFIFFVTAHLIASS